MRRSLLSALVLGGITIALPSAALANTISTQGQPPPPPGQVAAEAVYTENIPTSSGSQRVGQSPTVGQQSALPTKARRGLRDVGSQEGSKLTAVATAPALGAPPSPQKTAASAPHFSDAATVSFWGAFRTALRGGDTGALLTLLVALVLTSVFCVFLAARSRGRRVPPADWPFAERGSSPAER